MKVGIPKEIKPGEFRVALTPKGVREAVKAGYSLYVEEQAGKKIGFEDTAYLEAGAKIVSKKELFDESEMILKVKEPQKEEYDYFRPDHHLFSFVHAAADAILQTWIETLNLKVTPFESIIDQQGKRPLLAVMSEIAGQIGVSKGSLSLQKSKGLLVGSVNQKPQAKVLVLGAGVAGTAASRVASGMGSRVVVYDHFKDPLDRLLEQSENDRVSVTTTLLQSHLAEADLIIGAILLPDERTPWIIRKDDLKVMKKGTVLVDISVDQGGCFETTRSTTHDNPTYEIDGVVHYAVANMPSAVPLTATLALEAAVLPYLLDPSLIVLPSKDTTA